MNVEMKIVASLIFFGFIVFVLVIPVLVILHKLDTTLKPLESEVDDLRTEGNTNWVYLTAYGVHAVDREGLSMNDIISRNAAIDALAEEWYHNTEDYRTAVRVIGSLPSAQPKQRWIPCSEALPEKGQECLVCDGKAILIDIFMGDEYPGKWKWNMRDYEAWQPLPEPYKESEA